jgi:hypothetical protein
MTTKREIEIQNRMEEIYNRLVDETANEKTLFSARKNKYLSILLDVVEYIKNDGIAGENPLDDIFGKLGE